MIFQHQQQYRIEFRLVRKSSWMSIVLDALCFRWIIPEMEIPAIRSTASSSCTPETPTTFLFAYSNDLDALIVKNAVDTIVSKLQYYQSKYQFLGNVRFDLKEEERINYTSDIGNFSSSVNSHSPDQSLGFPTDSTGSDVLTILSRFLNNTKSPVCGASILILLKRNPNENNTTELISQLQNQHVFVRTIALDNLLGGSDLSIMFNISSETNGLGVFANSDFIDEMIDYCTDNILNEYLLYSTNPIVSGNGQITLPPLQTPYDFSETLSVFIDITVQNHPLTDNFISLNLTLTNPRGVYQTVLIDRNRIPNFTGYYNADIFLKGGQYFNVTLIYSYSSDVQEEGLEVRMSINQEIACWPAYNN